MTQKASELIIPKLDELTKQVNDLALSMVTQFALVHEELNAIKEKQAAAPKKASTRAGTSKTTQTLSPSGKKTYSNKMIWWKDMFASHYEQFVKELFTPELEADTFLTEAEEAMQDGKNKDKVGEAKYKAMADYIWKTKIKDEGHKKFRDAVLKKFEDQKNNGGDAEEATAEDNDGDNNLPNDTTQNENPSVNDNEDGENVAEPEDDDDSDTPAVKPTSKKVKSVATPSKAPAKPVTKTPSKTVVKSNSKVPPKTVVKGKK